MNELALAGKIKKKFVKFFRAESFLVIQKAFIVYLKI